MSPELEMFIGFLIMDAILAAIGIIPCLVSLLVCKIQLHYLNKIDGGETL